MIVKIQRSLYNPGLILVSTNPLDDEPVICAQIEMNTQAISAILGEDLKGYFEAEIEDDGRSIVIGKRVDDEDW